MPDALLEIIDEMYEVAAHPVRNVKQVQRQKDKVDALYSLAQEIYSDEFGKEPYPFTTFCGYPLIKQATLLQQSRKIASGTLATVSYMGILGTTGALTGVSIGIVPDTLLETQPFFSTQLGALGTLTSTFIGAYIGVEKGFETECKAKADSSELLAKKYQFVKDTKLYGHVENFLYTSEEIKDLQEIRDTHNQLYFQIAASNGIRILADLQKGRDRNNYTTFQNLLSQANLDIDLFSKKHVEWVKHLKSLI